MTLPKSVPYLPQAGVVKRSLPTWGAKYQQHGCEKQRTGVTSPGGESSSTSTGLLRAHASNLPEWRVKTK